MSCYLSMHISFFCADINQNRALIKAVDTFAYRLCFQALLPLEKKLLQMIVMKPILYIVVLHHEIARSTSKLVDVTMKALFKTHT